VAAIVGFVTQQGSQISEIPPRSKTLTGDDYADIVEQFSEPDPQPRQILEMVLEKVLGELPDSQRDIVERRIQGESVVDIAASTQRSRRTVERVIKKFRDQIAELTDDQ
jgi:DNA-directed RNA polymerase specialized sigma24 family protein